MVIDSLVRRLTGGAESSDYGGRRAGRGQVSRDLLDELLADSYFARRPPKSAGAEIFVLHRGKMGYRLLSNRPGLPSAAEAGETGP